MRCKQGRPCVQHLDRVHKSHVGNRVQVAFFKSLRMHCSWMSSEWAGLVDFKYMFSVHGSSFFLFSALRGYQSHLSEPALCRSYSSPFTIAFQSPVRSLCNSSNLIQKIVRCKVLPGGRNKKARFILWWLGGYHRLVNWKHIRTTSVSNSAHSLQSFRVLSLASLSTVAAICVKTQFLMS